MTAIIRSREPHIRPLLLAATIFASTATLGAQSLPNPFLGSVTAAPVTDASMTLSLTDAIERGLQYNLGLIDASAAGTAARAARRRALSALLPTVTATAAKVYEEASLREVGLSLPGLPPTTGGFAFEDVRLRVTQSVYSGDLRNRYRAEAAAERAAALNVRDARDEVVFVVGQAFLRVVTSAARLDTATAQLASAVELERLAADRVRVEVAPEIDALRAQVERQSAEQRVVTARNEFEKHRAALARIIGLSVEQRFVVDARLPVRGLGFANEAVAFASARRLRADLASTKAATEAAERTLRARRAQAHPSVGITADYGGGGDHVHFNHVYTAAAGVTVPLYTGGRIAAEVAEADSTLQRLRAESDDLEARVVYEVHVAWLDLSAAESNATVAQSNLELAKRALTQSQDRYANGVTTYLEVVQSQELVVRADEALIVSVHDRNLARLALARAAGTAEVSAKEWFAQ